MRLRETAGGIILLEGQAKVVIVQTVAEDGDIYHSWPKGRVERNENLLDGAIREIREEAGLKSKHLELLDPEPIVTYHRSSVEGIMKRINLFLFSTTREDLDPLDSERHPEALWVGLRAPLKMLKHEECIQAYSEVLSKILRASKGLPLELNGKSEKRNGRHE